MIQQVHELSASSASSAKLSTEFILLPKQIV